MTGRERERKILVLNSVHTQPEQENSKKKAKKNQKIKKPLSGIIYSPNRTGSAEKKRKKISPNSKKMAKKIQKLKNLFPALFLAKVGGDRPTKREKKF